MLRAVIFDCDGIIVNSEPHHLSAFQQVLSGVGITLSREDYYKKYLAMDDEGCFGAVFRDRGRTLQKEILRDLIAKKKVIYEELASKELILYPGVVDLVRRLKGRYRLAVASGALLSEVRFALEKGGIAAEFPIVITAEAVKNGKPHPESFLEALKGLNRTSPLPDPPIRPDEALVIEDSLHGVDGAKAAGMLCLAVSNSYPKDQLTRADHVVETLEGIGLEELEGLFT
ncbi:MAG TPA: HAD family phosphatase [Nitrospiria bacterium]